MPRSLHRTVRRGEGGGEPLPDPWPTLAGPGHMARFRRSELSLVAAEPGDGKSTFALVAAVTMGQPTLYVSCDSSAHEQATRLLALATGKSRDEVEPWLGTHAGWCSQQLSRFGHITWCFDSGPTLDDVVEEIDAYIVQHGQAPALVIVDNASDVWLTTGDGEWGNLRALMRELKALAREYDFHVMALHHTAERTDSQGRPVRPDPAPARSAIQGKISAVPSLVLTLTSNSEYGWMHVAVVKNRSGPSYPDGKTVCEFLFDPSVMSIRDLREAR